MDAEISKPDPGRMIILIVDDDVKLCGLVADYLHTMGYGTEQAHTGAQGLQMALSKEYDAVILDVMMPGMDGFEVLRNLRRESNVPVLMLTARGEETDRIVGLEMGADDYLPKTFSSRELLARLRAVIRRASGTEKKSAAVETKAGDLVFGDLQICKSSRTVRMGNETVNLTPVEYDLLMLLADASGRVLTRDHLLNAFADRSYDIFDRSVDVHISSLRRKLKENPRNPKFIRTVRTAGYMFTDPGDPA